MTPASAIEVVAAKIAQLFVLLLGMTGLALTVARLDPVALAHGDLADAAGRLRGYEESSPSILPLTAITPR
jgi:hypothetical protein